MTRSWFAGELETVATYWRIERTDGVALGFVSHDRDLVFGGLVHRSAPGMVPSAIRLSSALEPDDAEISGALTHDSIREDELSLGRFDGAKVVTGLVDWQNLEHEALFAGTIGGIERDGAGFSAELQSIKAVLQREIVPRTSPTCRAEFCGPGCTLPASRFTHEGSVLAISQDGSAVMMSATVAAGALLDGTLRWVDGLDAGRTLRIEAVVDGWLHLEREVPPGVSPGARAELREGCDHTLQACSGRFANAVNFQGEPFLPGNDLLSRYPLPLP